MATPVEVSKAMKFFEVVGQLKRLKRTGWVNHGSTPHSPLTRMTNDLVRHRDSAA